MLVLGGPSPSSSSSTRAKNEGCACAVYVGGRMESGGSLDISDTWRTDACTSSSDRSAIQCKV
jgi:hypothetical protein